MLSVQTPAKINLFLNIRTRRPDGFHEILSVMQAVRLWDRLDVTARDDERNTLFVSCNVPALERNLEHNLVAKAYNLFWEMTGLPPLGLKVHLEKGIPLQAGLGGGSSDAAAMLIILNHLSHAGLSDEQLCMVGGKLGSDIPFFIRGGLAIATGRGERIEPMPGTMLDEELPLVIIKPHALNIDTALAYHRFASGARYEYRSPDHILTAITEGKPKRRMRDELPFEAYLFNDFEKVLFMECPILDQMARRMKDLGVRRPLLSGSGSAMVGFIDADHAARKAIMDAFPKQQFDVLWTKTYAGGPVQMKDALPEALLDPALV
jgi:4-diphosphocytidyl-2-C-methyl-D-erythritol kinase